MLLTVHALTGTLIALSVKDPTLAAPLSFASHFVLDSTPHFGLDGLDFKTVKGFIVGAADTITAFITFLVMLYIFPTHAFLIAVGVFFACLPDLLYLPDIFLGIIPSKRLLRFHSRIQWSQTPLGTLTDVSWAAFVIFLLSRFR